MSPYFMFACCDSTEDFDIFLEHQFDAMVFFTSNDDDDSYPDDTSSHIFDKTSSYDDDNFDNEIDDRLEEDDGQV
jgi:hypothetical protein